MKAMRYHQEETMVLCPPWPVSATSGSERIFNVIFTIIFHIVGTGNKHDRGKC